MEQAYRDGVLAAANIVAEDAQYYNELAEKLLDLSDGRMSIHPADKMQIKKYKDKVVLLQAIHKMIEALLHDETFDSDS